MARATEVGCAHHIAQRGNNRQDVFFVDQDREVYLQILPEQAGKYGLEILGCCLMRRQAGIGLGSSPRLRVFARGNPVSAEGRTARVGGSGIFHPLGPLRPPRLMILSLVAAEGGHGAGEQDAPRQQGGAGEQEIGWVCRAVFVG